MSEKLSQFVLLMVGIMFICLVLNSFPQIGKSMSDKMFLAVADALYSAGMWARTHSGRQAINANVTVPAGVRLYVLPGATLSIDSGVRLTFPAP